MSSRKLDDLCTPMRHFAFELIARCAEEGIPVMVIDVLRSPEEQLVKVQQGVSKTLTSKHLAGKDGRSRALDLCPFDHYELHGPDKLQWDTTDPSWGKMAQLAAEVADRQGLRIRRGYDWGFNPGPPVKAGWDPGHFELDESAPIGTPV